VEEFKTPSQHQHGSLVLTNLLSPVPLRPVVVVINPAFVLLMAGPLCTSALQAQADAALLVDGNRQCAVA
jgi:hypothetical protein